jgi:sporulation protein YlmC with PRC-barrel domain
MRRRAIITAVVALLLALGIAVEGWAEKAKVEAPVVGGAIVAVNVEVVATTGYRASKLLGSDVYNDQGQKIGKLDDFIVGSEAEVSVAVVSVGGFLGMGSRLVAVPATLVESNDQGQVVLPGATKEMLKGLPAFQYAK